MKATIKYKVEPILYKICLLEANAIINKLNEVFAPINLPPLTSIPRTRDWKFLEDKQVMMGRELIRLIKNHVTDTHNQRELIYWISNYKTQTRRAWIKDFVQNTSLPMHQDFDLNIKHFSNRIMDTEMNIKEWFHFMLHEEKRDASCLMRCVFSWYETEQGEDIWSMMNTCYLLGVPLNITNDIYVKLCNTQSIKINKTNVENNL